jgi:4-carboxymuconolactone decarboxylase
MVRLPYADTDSAPSSIREVLGRHPVSFLRMLAHAEGAFDPWLDYTRALLGELQLEPILRELAILQVARLVDSEYQWVQHAVIARAVGASPEQIAAIEEGREDAPCLDEAQREVLRFAREVAVDGGASEEALAALAGRLGPRQVMELLLVIGQWLSICAIVATLGLQPDLPAMAISLPEGLDGPPGGAAAGG